MNAIKKDQLSIDQLTFISSTSEREAFGWLYIDIIERDEVARKRDIMNEATERLLPVRELMIGVPFDPNSEQDRIDYHNRSGSLAQKMDYDCGNGRNWITRQTGGVNGMISFVEGGAEAAKEELSYNDRGRKFLDLLEELSNQQPTVEPIAMLAEAELIAAQKVAEKPKPVIPQDPSEWFVAMSDQMARLEAKLDQIIADQS